MTEEEIIQNIGTIARSGTSSFLDNITGDKTKRFKSYWSIWSRFLLCIYGG